MGWFTGLLFVVSIFALTSFSLKWFRIYPLFWIPTVLSIIVWWWNILTSGGSGEYAWLGPFIVGVISFPTLLLLGLLGWNYPRNWNVISSVGGIGLFVAIVWTFTGTTSRTVSFVVTNISGAPVPAFSIKAQYPGIMNAQSVERGATDSNGVVRFHPPKREVTHQQYFWATIQEPTYIPRDSRMSCRIECQGPDQTEKIEVTWSYFTDTLESVSVKLPLEYQNQKEQLIPLVVRTAGESLNRGLSARWRQEWPQAEIHDLTLGGLVDMSRLLVFYQGRISEQRDDLQRIAENLRAIDSLQRFVRSPSEKEDLGSLCEYLTGNDPKDEGKRREILREFTQVRANQMIQWLEPTLPHGRESFQILEALGPLARPFAAKFATLYPLCDAEAKNALLHSLFRIGPNPRDVFFLLELEEFPFEHFLSAQRCRSRKDIDADWAVIQTWIEAHPGKLTPDQIESIKAELKDRRR